MHKFLYIFCDIAFGFVVGACTPYVDARREAGQIDPVGQSKAPNIAVCYNPVFSDDAEIAEVAKQACPSKKAKYQDTKYFNCTFFYPNTAFYKCK